MILYIKIIEKVLEGGAMVFPVETEERVKRRALSICQDHVRKVLEVSRRVTGMVDSFVKGDRESARQAFTEIKKLEEEVNDARRAVARELSEIGGLLTSREDFLRFIYQANEIADFYEGIGFRLLEIMGRGWEISSEIKKGLTELSDGVFEAVTKLREMTMTLNYSSAKALEKAKEVDVAERRVDDLYRELEIKVLNSKMGIPLLLLLRDVIQMLEDVSDKTEDASDAACILAFAM
jgi:predicted phosphate transport protein (TIGR00153 family)